MRPTFAEIDLSAIAHNIDAVVKRVFPAQVMAVVKANAYGHGVIPVTRTALAHGATYLGVALLEEGMELRSKGIEAPILVFGGAVTSQLRDYFAFNLEPTIYTKEIALGLSQLSEQFQAPISVHIKVDTGMGRVGIALDETIEFIGYVNGLKGVVIKGLYTHFATSDERDKSYANLQFDRFKRVIAETEEMNIRIPLKHAANSGAILDLPETYLDMVRPGVMMYGYYPSNETTESIDLKPAMTFKSAVIHVKIIPAGASVSYGRKFIARQETRIATIPVGYADGYNRLLTNKGRVTIRGKQFPVVGRVCMDLILVDVGLNDVVEIGDEVILFGRTEDHAFTVNEICNITGTIPYEVTCWVSSRVPRVYIN
ncbi:MAG: alanine racemase [Candidatus Zhuqueibacterota bacterium]